MAIVSFMFNSMEIRREDNFNPRVKIRNNINVQNIESVKMNLGSSQQDGLRLSFEYLTVYGENSAKIKLLGNVIFMANSDTTKEYLRNWEKSKALPNNLVAGILDQVLHRCAIQALLLSKEMGLPSPVQLPKVTTGALPAQAIQAAAKKEVKPEATKKAKK